MTPESDLDLSKSIITTNPRCTNRNFCYHEISVIFFYHMIEMPDEDATYSFNYLLYLHNSNKRTKKHVSKHTHTHTHTHTYIYIYIYIYRDRSESFVSPRKKSHCWTFSQWEHTTTYFEARKINSHMSSFLCWWNSYKVERCTTNLKPWWGI